jgi:ABC-type nickel/cobalt efflux system permease component RcnA
LFVADGLLQHPHGAAVSNNRRGAHSALPAGIGLTGIMTSVAAFASNEGFRVGLVISTFGFGLRHGVDWDHIAAITDITSAQDNRRRSMLYATLYVVGHAAVVFVLGSLAVLGGDLLPAGIDRVMERVVGATLLVLGAYVFYALVRHGRDFRMRSRWMLLFAAVTRAARRLRRRPELVEIEHEHEHGHDHEHEHVHLDGDRAMRPNGGPSPAPVAVVTHHRHVHRHRAPMPDDPFTNYGKLTSFVVGMLHGIGAETATQVLVFVAAAKAGTGLGELLLLVFILGLVTSNTGIALASTIGYLNGARSFRVYATVAVITGVFSLVVGSLFLLGSGSVLPAIFGG